jgi:putative copper export protein
MVDALSVLIRALSFVAIFEAAGGALFVAAFGTSSGRPEAGIRRRLRIVAVAAMLLVLLHYGLEAARLAGDLSGLGDRQMQQLVWHTAPGTALRVKLLGLLLVFAGLLLPRRRIFSGLLGVSGIAVIIAAFTTVGHTVAQPHRVWLALLLSAHLASITFWFGALWPLRQAVTHDESATAAALLERFSRFAVWIVPGLFVAGASLVLLLVPGLSVFGQAYGQLLLVKIGGFSVLMVLAGLNKVRLTPALRHHDPAAVSRLRRSLLLEYLIIAAVLAVTAVMTGLYSPE